MTSSLSVLPRAAMALLAAGVVGLSAGRGVAQTNAAAGVAPLRSAFTNAWQRYEAEQAAASLSLQEQYRRGLETLRGALQKSGDLDGVLAVKSEIDRFALDRRLSFASSDGAPADLKALQSRCVDAAARLGAEQQRKRTALVADYVKRLGAMQRTLTITGKLNEALEVKAEIERVQALPELAGGKLPPAAANGQAAENVNPEENRAAPSESSASLRRGLVLHFAFDRNEGKRVSDQSGRGNHGVVEGAKWVAGGKSGALRLDGEGSSVRVAHRATLDTPGALSVFAWIKAGGLGGYNRVGMIAHKFYNDSSNPSVAPKDGSGWLLQIHSTATDGAVSGTLWNKTVGVSKEGAKFVADGSWHLVGMVYSGGDDPELRLYVDGKEDRGGQQGGVIPSSIRNNSKDLYIGRYTYDSVHPPLRGDIDDLRVYNRALSADEARQLYDLAAASY